MNCEGGREAERRAHQSTIPTIRKEKKRKTHHSPLPPLPPSIPPPPAPRRPLQTAAEGGSSWPKRCSDAPSSGSNGSYRPRRFSGRVYLWSIDPININILSSRPGGRRRRVRERTKAHPCNQSTLPPPPLLPPEKSAAPARHTRSSHSQRAVPPRRDTSGSRADARRGCLKRSGRGRIGRNRSGGNRRPVWSWTSGGRGGGRGGGREGWREGEGERTRGGGQGRKGGGQ